jgi:nucleoid DNA-binding protein
MEKQANIPHKQAEMIVNIADCMVKALYDDDRIEIRSFWFFANRNYKSYENLKQEKWSVCHPRKYPFLKLEKS